MKNRARLFARLIAALACTWMLVSVGVHAQDNPPVNGDAAQTVMVSRPPPLTRVEALLLEKTVLVVRGFTDIATVQGDEGSSIRLTAVELTDLTLHGKEYGLAIEVSKGERRAVSYIDYDEIDLIIAALNMLTKFDNSITRLANYDVTYHSRGGLDFASYTADGSRTVMIRAAQYFDPSNQLVTCTALMRLATLPELSKQLAEGKQALDKAKAP